MILELNGIDVDCIIGERADERNRLQNLRVEARLDVRENAAESDELSETVDYAALTESIRSALVEARCKMIERAARVVCDVCLANPVVRSATVRVTKCGAIPHLMSASAVFSAGRSGENGNAGRSASGKVGRDA